MLPMKQLAILTLSLLAACGSKASTPTTPTTEPAKAELPDVPFEQLDPDQRIEFMKQKVMPELQAIFQAHDAQEFAEFGCVTCHGEQAKQGQFDMPNPSLPKLNQDMSGFKKEDLEWMSTKVKPAMARLLGRSEWSPDNPQGFGCAACHTFEQ
jgi:cytochrome c553